MTKTTTAAAEATVAGYNIKMTPVSAPEASTIATGTAQVKFRAKMTLRGKEVERTVMAQGKSVEFVEGVEVGNEVTLRCLFEEAPAAEEGKRGGQFLSVVGKPRAKKAA
jgi:hypothetical protein